MSLFDNATSDDAGAGAQGGQPAAAPPAADAMGSDAVVAAAMAAATAEGLLPPADGQAPADGQPPADLPWWERAVPGKWKTEEDALKGYAESSREARRLADEAKAASEKIADFEKLTQGVIGAPVDEDGKPTDYQFKLPEGAEFQPELLGKLTEFARARNLSQDVMQSAINDIVLPWQIGLEMGMREHEKAASQAYFGTGEDDRAFGKALGGLRDWAASMLQDLGAEALDDLDMAGNSAAAIKTLDRLRQRISGATIGRGQHVAGGGLIGKAEYDSITSAPGWQNDQASVAKVVAYLNATAPDDMAG